MMKTIPVAPFDFLVFGGAGDLSMRKLLPALYFRDRDGQLTPDARILLASRGEQTTEEMIPRVRDAIGRHVAPEFFSEEVWRRFVQRLTYISLEATAERGWDQLATLLADRPEQIRVFYLATAPDLFGEICRNLARHGLITPQARVVLEKPIGHDLASARQINEAVGAVFEEHQIFRIDHYLGKEAVQNLLALRFANSLFETLWSRTAIDHVQITVAETIGVEQRGGYYDKSGALRDMVQNHLLQLLCLVAMDGPSSLDPDDVRDEKLKVLRTLKPITAETVGMATVRGQYRQGAIDGASVGVSRRSGPVRERYRDVPGAESRGQHLALGRRAVLPAYRQAAAGAGLGDRHPVPAGGPQHLPERGRSVQSEPPGHPSAARRRHQIAAGQQGSGPRRLASAQFGAQLKFRGSVQDAFPRGLRAAADGCGAGQCHLVHAPRRGRGRLELGRADPGRLGPHRPGLPALYGRHLGSFLGDRADRTRRTHLARRADVTPAR
jgi:hypothetical protein